MKKKYNLIYLWIRNGKLHLKDDASPLTTVQREEDLLRIK